MGDIRFCQSKHLDSDFYVKIPKVFLKASINYGEAYIDAAQFFPDFLPKLDFGSTPVTLRLMILSDNPSARMASKT